jgi:hypothetical protein
MSVQFLKSFLADPFQHLFHFRVAVMESHVDIVPDPYPAAPLVRFIPERTAEDVMLIKIDLPAGDEAFLFGLKD